MTSLATAVMAFAFTPLILLNTFSVYIEYRKAFRDEKWGETTARISAAVYFFLTYAGLLNVWCTYLAMVIFFAGYILGSGGGWKKLKKKLSSLRDTMTSVEAATWHREMAEAR